MYQAGYGRPLFSEHTLEGQQKWKLPCVDLPMNLNPDLKGKPYRGEKEEHSFIAH